MALKEDLAAYLKTFRKLSFLGKVYTSAMLLIGFLNIADIESKIFKFKGFLEQGLSLYQHAKAYLISLVHDLFTLEVNEIGLDFIIYGVVWWKIRSIVTEKYGIKEEPAPEPEPSILGGLFLVVFYGYFLVFVGMMLFYKGFESIELIAKEYFALLLIVFTHVGGLLLVHSRWFRYFYVRNERAYKRKSYTCVVTSIKLEKAVMLECTLMALGLILLIPIVAAISSGLAT